MKNLILFLLVILCSQMLALEVGGHITQDTTWGPENNPYLVTEVLIIDEGVTLNILPGTEVRIKGANKNNYDNFNYVNGVPPVAKMIRVIGKIIAKGTENSPILFDKIEEDPDFYWGSIGIVTEAPESEFEFCHFNHSLKYYDQNLYAFKGAISFFNGKLKIRNCTFINNNLGLHTISLSSDLLIYNCKFIANNIIFFNSNQIFLYLHDYYNPNPQVNQIVIANCSFDGIGKITVESEYAHQLWINNHFINTKHFSLEQGEGNISFYGNRFIDGEPDPMIYSATENDSVYFRKNYMWNYSTNSNISQMISKGKGYNFISDNEFIGKSHLAINAYDSTCTINLTNNYINIKDGNLYFDGSDAESNRQINVFNNLIRSDLPTPTEIITYLDCVSTPKFYNNTMVNFSRVYRIFNFAPIHFYNNIITDIDGFYAGDANPSNPPVLAYNCLEVPIPANLSYIDGGNNIVADPLFFGSGDHPYALDPTSPCIDTGLNLADLPAYDYLYHKRTVSGLGGTEAIVDRGAYEYNSVYVGGMELNVYDSYNGQIIDCVKAQISGFLPEFTDSLGYLKYITQAGSFEVKLSRWDYYDKSIIVNVIEGFDSQITVEMDPINPVATDDISIIKPRELSIDNYPNPFNPSTRICFDVPKEEKVSLNIYNIKGQKVRSLVNEPLSQGRHEVLWDGKDKYQNTVSSGIYFVRIEQQGKSAVRKMMMIK